MLWKYCIFPTKVELPFNLYLEDLKERKKIPICINVKIALNYFLIHGPNMLKVCSYFTYVFKIIFCILWILRSYYSNTFSRDTSLNLIKTSHSYYILVLSFRKVMKLLTPFMITYFSSRDIF